MSFPWITLIICIKMFLWWSFFFINIITHIFYSQPIFFIFLSNFIMSILFFRTLTAMMWCWLYLWRQMTSLWRQICRGTNTITSLRLRIWSRQRTKITIIHNVFSYRNNTRRFMGCGICGKNISSINPFIFLSLFATSPLLSKLVFTVATIRIINTDLT